jgi:hypothetical protein
MDLPVAGYSNHPGRGGGVMRVTYHSESAISLGEAS